MFAFKGVIFGGGSRLLLCGRFLTLSFGKDYLIVSPLLLRLALVGLLTAVAGAGCTRSLYRKRADRESYRAISGKTALLPPELHLRDPLVDPDPESRFFSGSDPDHPPMPPDDPVSHQFMVRVAGKAGPAVWKPVSVDDAEAELAWREKLPKDSRGTVLLDLKSAMRLARINSRDFQREKEDLYLSALDLTYERFRFSPQFALGSTAGAQAANALGRASEQERASVLTDGSVRWMAATGGQLLASFANSFVWTFRGSQSAEAAGSLINFSLLQPLLRLGGRERTLAPLTQAERSLLANVRQMVQFQNGFFVRIASGRNSGEGPARSNHVGAAGLGLIAGSPAGRTGAPRADGFFYILEEEQRIRNLESNVARLRESLDQLAAAFEAGRLSSRLQVDQARQALLNSQSQLLSARASYETRLDAYKMELGLPPNLPVAVRDPLLEKFRTTDPAATALDRRLVVLLAQIQNRDLIAHLPELKEFVREVRSLSGAMQDLLRASQTDLGMLRGVVPARKKQLAVLATSELAHSLSVEPDRLNPELLDKRVEQFAERGQASARELHEFGEALGKFESEMDGMEIEGARSRLVDLTDDLSGILLSISLNQTAVRLESAVLPQIDLAEEAALEIARENRLDWMNARARLVDYWRVVGVQANALQSAADFSLFGGIGTVGNQAARFDGRSGNLRGALRFDTPLNRVAERNDFREAQIEYQRARRDYMLFEDRISQSLRNTLRIVKISQLNFELRRSAIQIAISKVDLAKMRLQEPPRPGVQATIGATTARDLVDALNDLLESQNDFLSLRVGFDVLRMLLDFEVGTFQTDPDGQWIDPGVITQASLSARAPHWFELPAGTIPADPAVRPPEAPGGIPLRASLAVPASAGLPPTPVSRVSFRQATPTVR